MSALDLELLATKIILNADNVLTKCGLKRKDAKALSRRAKELPSLIQQAGLFQAVAFYLSKINENLYKYLYEKLNEGLSPIQKSESSENSVCYYNNKDMKEEVKQEVSKEGAGYTFLLAMLAHAISTYSNQLKVQDCNSLREIVDVVKCMLRLREEGLLLNFERALSPYLITIKRLSEALY